MTSRERLKVQVQQWAQRIGVKPSRVQIQDMTTKWASCSPSGRLCFSTRLLRQPPPFREMVIVHELVHLKIPNHGRLFRALLRTHLPSERPQPKNICGATGKKLGQSGTNA